MHDQFYLSNCSLFLRVLYYLHQYNKIIYFVFNCSTLFQIMNQTLKYYTKLIYNNSLLYLVAIID